MFVVFVLFNLTGIIITKIFPKPFVSDFLACPCPFFTWFMLTTTIWGTFTGRLFKESDFFLNYSNENNIPYSSLIPYSYYFMPVYMQWELKQMHNVDCWTFFSRGDELIEWSALVIPLPLEKFVWRFDSMKISQCYRYFRFIYQRSILIWRRLVRRKRNFFELPCNAMIINNFFLIVLTIVSELIFHVILVIVRSMNNYAISVSLINPILSQKQLMIIKKETFIERSFRPS